jgi:hypothetical protein
VKIKDEVILDRFGKHNEEELRCGWRCGRGEHVELSVERSPGLHIDRNRLERGADERGKGYAVWCGPVYVWQYADDGEVHGAEANVEMNVGWNAWRRRVRR